MAATPASFFVLASLLLAPTVVLAAPETDDDDDEHKTKVALAQDPSGKLYERFEIHRGFFIASDVGLMWTFGGAERSYSNTQPYVGLDIGYDFNRWFSWQIHGGRGFNANSPRTPNQASRIRDFAWTNLQTGPVFTFKIWERVAIEVKLLGGVALLDPVPIEEATDGVLVDTVNPSASIGLGLKYFTLLANCALGLDVSFSYLVGVNVPVLTVSPLSIRYTF